MINSILNNLRKWHAKSSRFFHICENCPESKQIVVRIDGDGGLDLCLKCRMMFTSGACRH